MRRLLIAALVLAGLVAPPAVLAQIGSPPGIGSPPVSSSSPVFSGAVSGATFSAASGSQTAASYNITSWPALGWYRLPRIASPTHPQFAITGSPAAAPLAVFRNNASTTSEFLIPAQDSNWASTGTGEYVFTVSSGLTGSLFQWNSYNCSVPPCVNLGGYYGLASAAADSAIFQVGVSVGATANQAMPGVVAVGGNASYAEGSNPLGAFVFRGTNTVSSTNGIYIQPVGDPGAVRTTVKIPVFSGTVLVSTTDNTPDTGNSVWANTGSFLFEGSTANGFETELDTVDPTADRLIYLPDASGTVAVTNNSGQYTTPIVSVGDGAISHSYQNASAVALTEGAATSVVLVTPAENTGVGLQFQYVIYAADASDRQYRTGFVSVSVFNNAGTGVCGVGTANESVAVTAGTLTAAVDCNVSGGGAEVRLNATSSLAQTTLNGHGSVRSMSFSTTPPTVAMAGGS